MKYLTFEKSAIEEIINNYQLQSIEFQLASDLILYIRGDIDEWNIKNISAKRIKDGIIFAGTKLTKTIIVFDIEKSDLIEKCSDQDLLIILQKTFRYAIRFWNKTAPTNCEKVFKNHTVIFPFPYSKSSTKRIVLARNVIDKRLQVRGIKDGLLAYKYSEEGVSASIEESPETDNYRKSGEAYLELISHFRNDFAKEKNNVGKSQKGALEIVELGHIKGNSGFKYKSYEKQMQALTSMQRKIVEYEDVTKPIKIEGPAGTGKTAAMVLRTVRMIQECEKKQKPIKICYFTHSKSTEYAIKNMIVSMLDEKVFSKENIQSLKITTLQDFCIDFIKLNETQIIDLDASEAKQYQLFLIQEAYQKIRKESYKTYKFIMSDKIVDFFESEDETKIISLLQYEFSINIKGIAQSDLNVYKKITGLKNGIPFEEEADKEYIYRIFREYQSYLETQSVYDTDDIILETLARLNAPLWRRARVRDGIDYMFVDEMHLFNLNEQQIFHFLTKDVRQSQIPICFALDYGQVIGERSQENKTYIDQMVSDQSTFTQEFNTVFRSSQQIAELCASITSSGVLLFDAFVNPYKYCESGFIASEEALCSIPQMILYKTDEEMLNSLNNHIKKNINTYKCQSNDIALIFFDDDLLSKYMSEEFEKKYTIYFLNGRMENNFEKNAVICTFPEYVNGLEFSSVILIGVDAGRVPQTAVSDVSINFLKYNALNKLYLACSRARYNVTILGSAAHGLSSCLNNAIERESINVEEK